MGWTRVESDDNEMTWSEEGNLVSRRITFTETAGAGVYTGEVEIPAGGMIHTCAWETTDAWDAATTLLSAGVTGDLTRYDNGGTVDGVSQDVPFCVDSSDATAPDYFAAGTTFTAAITTTGVGGTLGRTVVTVVYSVPPAATAATKV